MVDEGKVTGFPNVVEGVRYFEDSYVKGTSFGGFEKSASAAIHFMQYHPSVIALKSMKDMSKLVDLPAHIMSLNSIAGFMSGIECNANAEAVWEKGTKPRLVLT